MKRIEAKDVIRGAVLSGAVAFASIACDAPKPKSTILPTTDVISLEIARSTFTEQQKQTEQRIFQKYAADYAQKPGEDYVSLKERRFILAKDYLSKSLVPPFKDAGTTINNAGLVLAGESLVFGGLNYDSYADPQAGADGNLDWNYFVNLESFVGKSTNPIDPLLFFVRDASFIKSFADEINSQDGIRINLEQKIQSGMEEAQKPDKMSAIKTQAYKNVCDAEIAEDSLTGQALPSKYEEMAIEYLKGGKSTTYTPWVTMVENDHDQAPIPIPTPGQVSVLPQGLSVKI